MGFCGWADVNERNKFYHDNEWGVPVHDDRNMFGEENLPIETGGSEAKRIVDNIYCNIS